MSWLKNALLYANKPKESIIGVLKQQLGGQRVGRSRNVVHASDLTAADFCPRKWALQDVKEQGPNHEFLAVAMDVTYQMGQEAERLLVESWAGEAVIGNWQCRYCHEQRSMCTKPSEHGLQCQHWWEYLQLVIEAPEYAVQGGIDAIFNVGAPRWMIVEIKTMNPEEFDKIVVPNHEHRLRTSLYMKLMAESESPYKDKFNTQEARVLYVSRGYGKMHPTWNEILPFKEFIVKRDDAPLKTQLAKAKAIKLSRAGDGMPSGICATALDKYAKKCSQCQDCFSGQFPAVVYWENL